MPNSLNPSCNAVRSKRTIAAGNKNMAPCQECRRARQKVCSYLCHFGFGVPSDVYGFSVPPSKTNRGARGARKGIRYAQPKQVSYRRLVSTYHCQLQRKLPMSKLQGQSTIFLHKPTKLPRVSQLKSVRPLSFPVVQFLVLVMEAPSLPCSCCCRFRQLTRSRLSKLLNQSPLRALLCLPRKARDTESIGELSPT